MSKQIFLSVLSFVLLSLVNCAPPPSQLTKCKASDEKCLLENAKALIPTFAKGLPDYNVGSLDPLQIKQINASQGNLLFVLTDITAIGLQNCEPKKIQRDPANSKLHISLLCTGKLDGQYEMKGSLLFVPIEGNGGVHVDLRSCLVNVDMDMEDKKGADGQNHWHIKSWSYTFELKDKSDVVFENLYNGNEILGRAARDLVQNNGNDIIREIGPPVIKSLISKVVKSINHFFKAIPSEELSLD